MLRSQFDTNQVQLGLNSPDTDTLSPSLQTEETSAILWYKEPAIGKSIIQLSDDILVESRSAKEDGNHLDGLTTRIVHNALGSILDITTSSTAKWTRIAASVAMREHAFLAYVNVLLRIDEMDGEAAPWIEPTFAVRTPAQPDYLNAVKSTRKRLPLKEPGWHSISGLFRMPSLVHCQEISLLVNLPSACRAQVASIDIVPLNIKGLHEDINVIKVLSPFHAKSMEVGHPVTNRGALITDTRQIVQAVQILSTCSKNPSELAADVILEATRPGGALLAEAYMEWAGYHLRIGEFTHGRRAVEILLEVLRQHMGDSSGSDLSEPDRIALQILAQKANTFGLLKIDPPRLLRVSLEGNARAVDKEYWSQFTRPDIAELLPEEGMDVEDGQVLHIDATTRLAPVAIAILRTVNSARGGVTITARSPQQGTESGKWEIIGYPEDKSLAPVGFLAPVTGAEIGSLSWCLAVLDEGITDDQPHNMVEPENAYAFILYAGEPKDLDYLVNLENCLIYPDAAALASTLTNANERVLAKPVIPIGKRKPLDKMHIASAVVHHWAMGGRYVISHLSCLYDRKTGNIRLRAPIKDEINQLVFAPSIISMPASETLISNMAEGLFVPSCRFGVTLGNQRVPPQEVEWLSRLYNPAHFSGIQHEYFSWVGETDYDVMTGIDLMLHWPIEKIVSRWIMNHRKLSSILKETGDGSFKNRFEDAIAILTDEDTDVGHFGAVLDEFLLEAALNIEEILQANSESILAFIALAKNSALADDIAASLSMHAYRICLKDISFIFPLFELLASCLPSNALTSAFSFAVEKHTKSSNRYLFRLAECMKRYGDVTSLEALLVHLHHEVPELCYKPELLSCFQPILTSDHRKLMERNVGSPLMKKIEGTIDIITRFDAAVRMGNRDAALRLVNNPDEMSKVNFTRWMDRLRGLSNELRALAIPVHEIAVAGLNRQPRQLLAAAIFDDLPVINTLYAIGQLEQKNDLNMVALNKIGRPDMLNAAIKESFETSGYQPFRITGETTGEVFDNAGRSIRSLPTDTADGLTTVIMSAFNPDIVLMEKSLQSMMAQSHTAVEIIVIDDASSHAGAAEIDALLMRFPDVHLIRLDTNCGPYIGRNLALARAKGSFIAIQDADDWSHPQRLEAQIKAFKEHPEAKLVTAQHIRIDRAGRVQFEHDFSVFGDGPMTSLFRRETFEEVGHFAKVRSRGDVEMRERIRSYYGHQAIVALPYPLMLCLAESSTLSQQILANNIEHLQLFRSNISRRMSLSGTRRAGRPLSSRHQIQVPYRLRAVFEGVQ